MLNVQAVLKETMGFVESGAILAREQFELPVYSKGMKAANEDIPELSLAQDDGSIIVEGEGFSMVFDKTAGAMTSYKSNGKELLQSGPVPNFWRAPIDNDFGNDLHNRSRVWRKAWDRKLVTGVSVSQDGQAMVTIDFEYLIKDEGENSLASYHSKYTVDGNGDVLVANSLDITRPDAPEIVRMGMNLVMPREYDRITWLGRGPHESYWDRKTSAFVDLYSGRVADQYWPYLRPQENGNKEDVRWMAITNSDGQGLLFTGQRLMAVSAHHNIMEDFESPERTDGRHRDGVKPVNRHTVDVKERDLTSVNIDYKQMGVGGDDSWGAWTHPEYRLTEKAYSYRFKITALDGGEDLPLMVKSK
jgi:beta-galactosidase